MGANDYLAYIQERYVFPCIKSESIKNYLVKIRHVFTEKEMITLIYNSKKTIEEKTKIFNELNSFKSDGVEFNGISFILLLYNEVRLLSKTRDGYFKIDDEVIYDYDELIDYLKTYNKHIARLYDGKTDMHKFNLYFNDNKELFFFCPVGRDYEKLLYELTYGYVDIPNQIKEGDKITVNGTAYIVLQESNLPDKLKAISDYVDTCLTAVEEDIYKTGNEDEMFRRHEHIHLTNID